MNAYDNLEEFTDPPNYDLEEGERSAFTCVKGHLAPNGVFAFETRNPSGHDLTDQSAEEFDQSYLSVEGHQVSVSFTQIYDPIAQIIYWTLYHRWNDGERDHKKETHIACRFTHPQELKALLYYNGFQVIQQFGNWNKEALSASSPSIISICKVRS